jgi:hypothetical protein
MGGIWQRLSPVATGLAEKRKRGTLEAEDAP